MRCFCCDNEQSDANFEEVHPRSLQDQVEEPRSSKSKGYAEVIMTFRRLDQTTHDVAFTSRPLGVDFKKTVPLKVKFVHPRSVAADAEVEEDWALVSIHGEAMPRNLKDSLSKVKAAIESLPNFSEPEEVLPKGRRVTKIS